MSAQSPKDTKRHPTPKPRPVRPAAIWPQIQKYLLPYNQTEEQLHSSGCKTHQQSIVYSFFDELFSVYFVSVHILWNCKQKYYHTLLYWIVTIKIILNYCLLWTAQIRLKLTSAYKGKARFLIEHHSGRAIERALPKTALKRIESEFVKNTFKPKSKNRKTATDKKKKPFRGIRTKASKEKSYEWNYLKATVNSNIPSLEILTDCCLLRLMITNWHKEVYCLSMLV